MIAAEWLDRAERSLKSARVLLDDDADSACNRAYYAMFYAARAALLKGGFAERAMGKTHSGMIAAFSEEFVRPGLLSVSFSRAFARAQQDRLVADYTGEGTDRATAQRVIADAGELIAAVRGLLSPP